MEPHQVGGIARPPARRGGRVTRPGYPETPRTVGEHLLKARLDRGIQQRDAAREIGCDPGTLLNWEKGRVAPAVRFWPKILAYLCECYLRRRQAPAEA